MTIWHFQGICATKEASSYIGTGSQHSTGYSQIQDQGSG